MIGYSGHVMVIDETPGPQGFGVRCFPHGQLGPWPTHLEAVIRACEHDDRHGGDWL